jgi:hypothetical protein
MKKTRCDYTSEDRLIAWRLGKPSGLLLSLAVAATAQTTQAQDAGVDAGPPPGPTPVPYFTHETSRAFPSSPGCVYPTTTTLPDGGVQTGIDATNAGCWTNQLVIADIDRDEDMDIVFANGGGYYVWGVPGDSTVYKNDGYGGFYDVTKTVFNNAQNRLRQVAVGDVNGDGLPDIYQPGGFGQDLDKFWIQHEDRTFTDEASLRLPGVMKSNAASVHFGDLDNDGDLDIAVNDWGETASCSRASSTCPNPKSPTSGTAGLASPTNVWIYENDGEGYFSLLPKAVVPAPLPTTTALAGGTTQWLRAPIDMDIQDVDNDFDLDLLIKARNGQSRIFFNDGTARFSDGTAGHPKSNGPYTYTTEVCDFDQDGDLDLFLDNAGARPAGVTRGNFTQLLVNDGNGTFVDESRARIFGEPERADDNQCKCADIDGDGKYDLLVSSLQTAGEKVFLNDGSGLYNYVFGAIPNPVELEGDDDGSLAIDVADLNGDGLLDVVTGQGEVRNPGIPYQDRVYFGSDNSKPDVTEPRFRAIEPVVPVPGEDTVIRFAVEDRVTSETGDHVRKVALMYAVGDAEPEELPAVFVGGDLFRAVIPAQEDGTLLKVTLYAEDWSNNIAENTFDLEVGDVPTEPDAGVESDAGTPTMDGGVPSGDGDAPAGDGDAPSGDGDAPAPMGDGDAPAGDGDARDGDDKSSDGCNVGGGKKSNGLGEMLLAGLMALGVRTRRRRKGAIA